MAIVAWVAWAFPILASNPMTKEQLTRLHKQLEVQLDELLSLSDESHSAAEVVELDQSRVGRLSRMDALQGQAISQEAERRREIEIKQTRAALQRFVSGEYGECEQCGSEIALARLEAKPAVQICIQCATENESQG